MADEHPKHHIHGPDTPCQIGCPAHPVKRVTAPREDCWCDGQRHRYWPGVMHWQCPPTPSPAPTAPPQEQAGVSES